MDLLLHQTIDGKYFVEQKLGQGGMGAVYRATHLGTTRPVALKVIAPQLMIHDEFVERFRREAKAAGLLSHPNVVNVTDFGFTTVSGTRVAYLVMEFLSGQSLAEVLADKKRVPLAFTVDVAEQTCLAVEEAHRRGIIHRDLKPDNIWLTPNGRGGFNVKVLDFGLAKLRHDQDGVHVQSGASVGSGPSADCGVTMLGGSQSPPPPVEVATQVMTTPVSASPSTSSSGGDITRVGTVLGTPLYMSPEQCSGLPLDERSDIYSLGVVVYQMLAGRPPFLGDMQRLIEQHVATEPPPLDADTTPPRIARVVGQALSKSPEDRPESAKIFASALRAQSETAGDLFRHAVALYSEHLPTFLKIAAFGYPPMVLIDLLVLAFTFLVGFGNSAWLWLTIPVVYLGIYFLFTSTRVFLAIAIEKLLTQPLSPIDVDAVVRIAVRRLGIRESQSRIRQWASIYARLAWFTIVFLSSPATPGNVLAVAASAVEGVPWREAVRRSYVLTSRLPHVKHGIQATAIPAITITATTFFLAVVGLFTLCGLERTTSVGVSLITALIVLSLNAVFVVPVVAATLTMFYFRARQAGGERLEELPADA